MGVSCFPQPTLSVGYINLPNPPNLQNQRFWRRHDALGILFSLQDKALQRFVSHEKTHLRGSFLENEEGWLFFYPKKAVEFVSAPD